MKNAKCRLAFEEKVTLSLITIKGSFCVKCCGSVFLSTQGGWYVPYHTVGWWVVGGGWTAPTSALPTSDGCGWWTLGVSATYRGRCSDKNQLASLSAMGPGLAGRPQL